MNVKRIHAENTRFINLYMDFMQHSSLPYKQALNLCTEIGRLNTYNREIESMLIEDFYNPLKTITITKESKLCKIIILNTEDLSIKNI